MQSRKLKVLVSVGLLLISMVLLAIPTPGECALYHYNYLNIIAEIKSSGAKTLGIATFDQRGYIISGNKSPSFVGLIRGGYGNPWSISTESGSPLAEDITQSIVASLSNNGYVCRPVIVPHTDSTDDVIRKIKETSSELLVLLTIHEWKSDIFKNITLTYDLNLSVFDKSGVLIAEKSLKGNDAIPCSFWSRESYPKKIVPQAFKGKLEELFNSPEISKSLE